MQQFRIFSLNIPRELGFPYLYSEMAGLLHANNIYSNGAGFAHLEGPIIQLQPLILPGRDPSSV
ncbi:hypothetical protein AG0111_0g11048 [Alternaria gaisen]|uniref:Uncharacterized protein n=1 Tax=Alternaria gaisen TaxID=167740 RepID=A0ACB6F8V4_9PLEO|nr:hypothetical protein AG0111_0g11048 [Alternaria gaisen]